MNRVANETAQTSPALHLPKKTAHGVEVMQGLYGDDALREAERRATLLQNARERKHWRAVADALRALEARALREVRDASSDAPAGVFVEEPTEVCS